MKVIKEINYAWDFDFWSGAKDTVDCLSDHEVNIIFDMLDELYPEGLTETQVNDFFWFEEDTIAEWLGYRSFEEIMDRKL